MNIDISSYITEDRRAEVLITGASSGFGRLTAEFLARKGYAVFATMRNIAGRNAGTAKALGAGATGVGVINEAAAQVRAQMLAGFGLADPAKFHTSSAAKA